MRYLSFLLATLLLLSACRKNNTDVQRVAFQNFEYLPGWEIKTSQDTIDGQVVTNYNMDRQSAMTMFRYNQGYDQPHYADGGYSLQVVWQVPATATSFSYKDQELATNLTHYKAGPPMVQRHDQEPITTGVITGLKTGENTWQITMDIMLPKKDATLNIQHIQHKGDYIVKYY